MEPHESKREVKGKGLRKSGEDDEAIMYFDFLLPRIKEKYPNMKVYQGLQNAGEVIFVPGDWWHGVVNTQDCVAVTQNYVGPDNFDVVWKKARRQREKVASLWLRNMRKFAPVLYERALALNRRDEFKMRSERGEDEKLRKEPDSSSSSSSSDSSSDEQADLDPAGLQAVVHKTLGAAAFAHQSSAPPLIPQPGRKRAPPSFAGFPPLPPPRKKLRGEDSKFQDAAQSVPHQ
jgi:hypothetical protein